MTDPREMLVSSGVDLWSKSSHTLVQDGWYRAGDYHLDKGQGLDFYHVGQSRGCGGLGIFDGKVLHNSRNYAGWKILADGDYAMIVAQRRAHQGGSRPQDRRQRRDLDRRPGGVRADPGELRSR